MKFFTLFRRPEVSGLNCPEHSLTEQVYKDQCDLNFLIKKYHLEDDPFELKMLVDPATRTAQFLDTTQVPDIYTALVEHQRVKLLFESLDYEIQKKFDFSVDAFADHVLSASPEEINKLNIPNLRFVSASEPDSQSTPNPESSQVESSSKA